MGDVTCTASGCNRNSRARGWCEMHYRRWEKTGTTDLLPRPRKVKAPCSVDGCGGASHCRGWCYKHYARWYETGSVELGVRKRGNHHKPVPLGERLWAKVDKTTDPYGCWLWLGGKTKLGYGMIWDPARNGHSMAYRVSYELLVGPIPAGLHIDHLCRRPSCVNPAHLEPVTPKVNTARGYAVNLAAAHQRAKTHCPQGHEYNESNTYAYNDGRRRTCKTCIFARTAARRKAKREGVPYVDPFRREVETCSARPS